MRKIALLGLTAAAVMAAAAGGAAANAATLLSVRTNGQPLALEAPLELTSSNLHLEMSPGAKKPPTVVNCTQSTIAGVLQSNRKANDKASATETTLAGGGEEGRCESTFNFTIKASVSLGMAFSATGRGELKSVSVELDPPPPHNTQVGTCRLQALSLKGSFPVGASEQPLVVTMTGQRLKVLANSGHECGTSGFLTATFTATSQGSPVSTLVEP